MKNRPSALLFFCAILFITSLLIGCGGSGGSGSSTRSYAGSYESTIALDSGKSGQLNLEVASDASASGTLVVTGGAPNAPSRNPDFSFSVGSISVSGNVNPDGTFTMTGTDPDSGAFGIVGNLPTSANGTGSITVNAGSSSYTSTITVAMGTGTGSLTFTNSGAAINVAPFPNNPYILMSTVGGNSAITIIPSTSDTSRSVSINLNQNVTAGTEVSLSGVVNGQATVFYSEGSGPMWIAQSGVLKVVSRTANTIKLQFTGVTFTSSEATGTFAINGTVEK